MNLAPWQWLLALGLPWALGLALLEALDVRRRAGLLFTLGAGWCLGALLLSLAIFVLAAFGSAPRLALLVPLQLFGIGLGLWLARRRPPCDEAAMPLPWHARLLFGLALTAALVPCADRMVRSLATPIHRSDEAHLWASRARLLHESDGFTPAYAAEFQRRIQVPGASVAFFVQHPDYPHLGPNLQAWVFAVAGRVTWSENRLPLELFGPALLLMLAGLLRRAVRWPIAAGIPLLVSLAFPFQQALTIAYLDLAVAAGLLLATIGWLWLRERGESRWFALFAAGLALLVSAKHEGALLSLALVLACAADGWGLARRGALRRPPRAASAWLLLPLACLALVWAFNRHFGFQNDLLSDNPQGQPFLLLFLDQLAERGLAVLAYFGRLQLFDSSQNLGLPAALLLLLLARHRRVLTSPALAPAVSVALATAGFAVVFVGTPHDLDWHLDTAAYRVLFQLLPTNALAVALLLDEASGDLRNRAA